jgi:hypothetical protein
MRQNRQPLVAATVQKLPLLCAPSEEPGECTARQQTEKGCSGPASPVVALQAGSQEPMAGFSDPSQEGGPGLVIAPRQGGGGEVVRAADIPPIRRDPPDELQTRGGLQWDWSMVRTGGIEAGLFVLLGRPSLAVRSSGQCGASSIPRHAAFIAKGSLSGSVVTRRDLSHADRSRCHGRTARSRSTSASQHGAPSRLDLRRSDDPASTSRRPIVPSALSNLTMKAFLRHRLSPDGKRGN